jgi:hypothetical protein
VTPEKSVVELRDFVGLIDNVDPRDIPPGAADDQVNAACLVMGELTVRAGYREVLFD